ncbi:MAG TPA: cytochrome b [Gammaproteobacteria bacterium]|nr:cytochrome b [Gammaproteobacteria bacterium]
MRSLSNTGSVYGPLSKFFHWVIAVLVILMLSITYFLDDLPNQALKGLAFNIHKLTGLTILALMVLRLSWTLCNRKPSLPHTALWERCAEQLVHWSFYLLLFLMPLAGWIGSVAGGRPPRLGNYSLNLPLAKNEHLSNLSFSVHNTVAIIIITLISLHVLAALFHHFIKKDSVLRRMLP